MLNIKDITIKLFLILSSILFVISILEIALRITSPIYAPVARNNHDCSAITEFDSNFGWFHKAALSTWIESQEYSTKVSLNSKRLRGREYSYKRSPGVKRIALLGDSFVFGLGVGDEDTVSARLEEAFNGKAEVMNMGVNGFGTGQEYLLYREEGEKYSPDIVFCFLFVGNDILENSNAYQYGGQKPYFTLDGNMLKLNNFPVVKAAGGDIAPSAAEIQPRGRIKLPFIKEFLQRHSYAYIFLRLRYNFLLYKLKIRSYSDACDIEKGWDITKAILLKFNDLCSINKSRFIVVIIPTKEQLVGADSIKFQNDFVEFAKANRLEYIDLLPHLSGRQGLNFVIDSHWNKRGTEAVAKILYEHLRANE